MSCNVKSYNQNILKVCLTQRSIHVIYIICIHIMGCNCRSCAMFYATMGSSICICYMQLKINCMRHLKIIVFLLMVIKIGPIIKK